jgi:DNA-binding transcriptional ArsR family regulator
LHAVRQKLHLACCTDSRGRLCLPVGRLQAKLDAAASTLSHHLKSLVVVGLVTQTREGTTLVCHANYDIMRDLLGYMVEECCAEGSCAPVVLPKVA